MHAFGLISNTCVILSHTNFFGVNNRNILSACYARKIAEKNFSEAKIKLIDDFYSDLHVERTYDCTETCRIYNR